MALVNPNIALSVKPIELADPMAQYSKMVAIQGAQQQNALAQQQMAEYERARAEEESLRNYLTQSDLTKPETRAGLMRFGKTGLAYGKVLTEQDTARLTQQKTEMELKAARKKFGDELKRNLSANPSNENVVAWGQDAVLQGIYTPQEVESTVQQLLALPPADRVRILAQSGATAAELAPKLSVGPTGIVQTPAFGGKATIVEGTAPAFQMTPAQIAQNKIAQQQLAVSQGQLSVAQQRLANEGQGVTYQQDAQGNIVALPTKIKPGDTPRGRTVAAPGEGMLPMAGKPSEAAAKETASINQQRAIIKGALDAIEKNPNAFGTARGLAGGALGETFGARAVGETPEETQARSFLFNVVSGVIKERAGTAQSAGEQATLNRFLPTTTDNADELKSKLKGFQDYLTARESAGKKGGTPPPSNGVDTSNPLLK